MVICQKNNIVSEYKNRFLVDDNIIIASYFSANDIEYLRKVGITILFQGTVDKTKETFKDLEIKSSKPKLKSIKREIKL